MKAKYIVVFILIVAIQCKIIFQNYPLICEKYFYHFSYYISSCWQRWVWGWIPFSAGDVFYIICIVSVLLSVFAIKKLGYSLLKIIILSAISLFLSFYMLWGMNYYKPSKQIFLAENHFSLDTLLLTTDYFLDRSKSHYHKCTENHFQDSVITIKKLQQWSYIPYQKLYEKQITDFPYTNASLKGSLFSGILSYMGYSGYLNPFTAEAQINTKIPNYQKPLTAFHEIAHQMGFAQENQANIIGFLACENSDQDFVKYSGTMFALQHCLIEIRKHNPTEYQKYLNKIPNHILKDFQKTSRFWQHYKNPLNVFFEKTYDSYLKNHQQKSGIQSYHQIIGFLVNYHLNQTKNVNLPPN